MPKPTPPETVKQVLDLSRAGKKPGDVAEILGIPTGAVYRIRAKHGLAPRTTKASAPVLKEAKASTRLDGDTQDAGGKPVALTVPKRHRKKTRSPAVQLKRIVAANGKASATLELAAMSVHLGELGLITSEGGSLDGETRITLTTKGRRALRVLQAVDQGDAHA